MAKFLDTSATNYFLEAMIKSASDRLILISPFLKLNDRMKELLADKNRLKIDVKNRGQILIKSDPPSCLSR